MATSLDAPRIRRRRALLALGGGLLFVGGVVALARTSGYDVPLALERKLIALEPWHAVVLTHIARRITAPDRAGDAPSADDVDVLGFIDGYVLHMAPPLRRDLLRLVAVVEHVWPVRHGYATRFSGLSPADQDRVLAGLESADEGLLRGGFAALKALVFMGYYRDPRTWALLHYDGPLVGRPAGGWQ